MPAADLPLSGIRVLDIATFIAAPFSASILGEFGAEVIKLEMPGSGDPFRRFGTPSDQEDSTLAWLSEARNKKSATLDLRRPEGAALLLRLVREADVLCENFRPGTLERRGLGPTELHAANPRLVILRVSGQGQTGRLRDLPGFARVAHAFGGLAHLAGMPDGPPVTPGSTSLADYMSGLYGAVGVLMALRVVERDGAGAGHRPRPLRAGFPGAGRNGAGLCPHRPGAPAHGSGGAQRLPAQPLPDPRRRLGRHRLHQRPHVRATGPGHGARGAGRAGAMGPGHRPACRQTGGRCAGRSLDPGA